MRLARLVNSVVPGRHSAAKRARLFGIRKIQNRTERGHATAMVGFRNGFPGNLAPSLWMRESACDFIVVAS